MTAEEAVRAAIKEHAYQIGYSLDVTWKELGCDSLDVVEILILIEDKLGKEINEKKLYDVKTVGDLVKIVETYC